MATVIETLPDNIAEWWHLLGDVPLERILARPPLGTATEADLIAAIDGPRKRLCELVEGVLVEKAMGAGESLLAVHLGAVLFAFVQEHDLGVVLGEAGPIRIFPARVRMPDVCFIPWERMPNGEFPEDAICPSIPDLAIEVLSESNTKKEMKGKLEDYFQAGVRLVWIIDPKTKSADVYESPKKRRRLGIEDSLDGGDVLPGFSLSLGSLFVQRPRKRK